MGVHASVVRRAGHPRPAASARSARPGRWLRRCRAPPRRRRHGARWMTASTSATNASRPRWQCESTIALLDPRAGGTSSRRRPARAAHLGALVPRGSSVRFDPHELRRFQVGDGRQSGRPTSGRRRRLRNAGTSSGGSVPRIHLELHISLRELATFSAATIPRHAQVELQEVLDGHALVRWR